MRFNGGGVVIIIMVPLNATGLSLVARHGTTSLRAVIDLGRNGKVTTAVTLRGTG